MPPFENLQGLEAFFSMPANNAVRQKRGRDRTDPGEMAQSPPFREMMRSMDQREADKPTKPHRPEEANASKPTSDAQGNQAHVTEKTSTTSQSGTPSGKDTSVSPDADRVADGDEPLTEGAAMLLPFQFLFEAAENAASLDTGPSAKLSFGENVSLQLEAGNVEEDASRIFSGPPPFFLTKQAKEASSSPVGIEKGLVLNELKVAADDLEAHLNGDIQGEDDALRAALQGKPSAKAETNLKANQEMPLKLITKALAQEGHPDFLGMKSEQEKKEGFFDPIVLAKSEIKGLSSDMPGFQHAAEVSLTQDDGQLSVQQKEAVISQVQVQFKHFQAGKTERIRFQLEPESLGSIQVDLSVQKGAVIAHIITGDPQVKALLEAHQGLLRDRLAEQGFRVDQFSVNVGDLGEFSDGRKESLHFPRDLHLFSEATTTQALVGFSSPVRRGNGLINLYV